MTQSPTDASSPSAGERPDAPDGRSGGRHAVMRLLSWVGVVVPVLLVAWYASGMPVVFDGAMNLQVARNVAEGNGYRWDYGSRELFPAAIQTSGPYIFLAAGFIKMLGATNFAFHAANIVFVLVLAVALSMALRHWPLLRVLGPSIVLLGTPGALAFGLSGYGELPVAALALSSFVLLDLAATSGRRPTLLMAAAACCIGVALTIKVVAAMAVPVLLLGVVLVVLLRHEATWWRGLLGVLGILPPLVLFEIYRLASLKSDYLDWWRAQLDAIGYQSGVDSSGSTTPEKHGLAKMAEHLHLLAQSVGLPAEALGPLLVLPFLALLIFLLAQRVALLDRIRGRGVVLLVLVSVYAGGYLVWWLALTPTEKAWLRRIVVGLVALTVACLLLAGILIDRLRTRGSQGRAVRATVWVGTAVALAAIVIGAFAVESTARGILDNARSGQNKAMLAAAKEAGHQARRLADSGATLYGIGWWSAPTVSLYGDVRIQDLTSVPHACELQHRDAYVVWDYYAKNLGNPVPRRRGFSFEPFPSASTPYAGVFRVEPGPLARCAS